MSKNNFKIFNSTIDELERQYKTEQEKFDKKQFTYVTGDDLLIISDLIKKAIDNSEKKKALCTPAPRTQRPPIEPSEIKMLFDKLQVLKLYNLFHLHLFPYLKILHYNLPFYQLVQYI